MELQSSKVLVRRFHLTLQTTCYFLFRLYVNALSKNIHKLVSITKLCETASVPKTLVNAKFSYEQFCMKLMYSQNN